MMSSTPLLAAVDQVGYSEGSTIRRYRKLTKFRLDLRVRHDGAI